MDNLRPGDFCHAQGKNGLLGWSSSLEQPPGLRISWDIKCLIRAQMGKLTIFFVGVPQRKFPEMLVKAGTCPQGLRKAGLTPLEPFPW